MAIRVSAPRLREAARAASCGRQETIDPCSWPCDRRKREACGHRVTAQPPELRRTVPKTTAEPRPTALMSHNGHS